MALGVVHESGFVYESGLSLYTKDEPQNPVGRGEHTIYTHSELVVYGQVSHLAGGEAEELEGLARGGSANAPFSTLSLSLATSHTPRHPLAIYLPGHNFIPQNQSNGFPIL